MTVFADGTKEALHGHNYQVSVRLRMNEVGADPAALERMLPFAEIKGELRALVAIWDEKTLLPRTCPFLRIEKTPRRENVAFTLAGAFYSLPGDEVEWLDCPTIACETLSSLLLDALLERIPVERFERHGVREISLRVLESPRQGATSVHRFGTE